jgi:hypothetical protein
LVGFRRRGPGGRRLPGLRRLRTHVQINRRSCEGPQVPRTPWPFIFLCRGGFHLSAGPAGSPFKREPPLEIHPL